MYGERLREATIDSDDESPQDHNGEARDQQRRARSMKVESVSQPPQIFSGTTQLPRWLAAVTMGHWLRRLTRHSVGCHCGNAVSHSGPVSQSYVVELPVESERNQRSSMALLCTMGPGVLAARMSFILYSLLLAIL